MKNYKITIQYDGTKYNGWQRQGNTDNTIQMRFENVLSKMCGKKIEIFASGRTDAGVHAKSQTANFKCESEMSEQEIKDYLNCYLPQDILVTSVEEAGERFHSRLNAKAKTYEYKISTSKPDVFIRKYVYHIDSKPDVSIMKSSSLKFLGEHDFKGFSSLGKTKKSTVRRIDSIDITEEKGLISIVITGNGFLYNMVRIICGTLLDIGVGKLDESVIQKVFETKSREHAGQTLPACGLTLVKVDYDDI